MLVKVAPGVTEQSNILPDAVTILKKLYKMCQVCMAGWYVLIGYIEKTHNISLL